jgi:hypothetical protein
MEECLTKQSSTQQDENVEFCNKIKHQNKNVIR